MSDVFALSTWNFFLDKQGWQQDPSSKFLPKKRVWKVRSFSNSEVFFSACRQCLKINATKSVFCVQETEYLGYILTRGGIKPQPKKVQATLMLNPPNNVKELQWFLGMVQYYRDMWQRCSEMLAPLTNLVGECRETKTTKKNKSKKKPWWWKLIHQQAFDNIKATIAKEVVLAYPDFMKSFEIYTDASTMQLGPVMTQE